MLELNETKVRTSKNFNINSIKIDDLIVPAEFKEFTNLDISSGLNYAKKSEIDSFENSIGIENEIKEKLNSNILLDITKNTENESILYTFDNQNLSLASDLKIIVRENLKADIFVRFESLTKTKNFAFNMIKVYLEKGATLSLNVINFLSDTSDFLIKLEADLEEGAKITINTADLGAKNIISNYYTKLNSSFSKSNINTIYIGKERDIYDYNYTSDLKSENSTSNIEVEGALLGKAKKHFKGTLDFKQGAKGAKRK